MAIITATTTTTWEHELAKTNAHNPKNYGANENVTLLAVVVDESPFPMVFIHFSLDSLQIVRICSVGFFFSFEMCDFVGVVASTSFFRIFFLSRFGLYLSVWCSCVCVCLSVCLVEWIFTSTAHVMFHKAYDSQCVHVCVCLCVLSVRSAWFIRSFIVSFFLPYNVGSKLESGIRIVCF